MPSVLIIKSRPKQQEQIDLPPYSCVTKLIIESFTISISPKKASEQLATFDIEIAIVESDCTAIKIVSFNSSSLLPPLSQALAFNSSK
jgi:hypothetical protein